MYQGQTVFAQLLDLLPRRAFNDAVRRYKGDRRVRKLSCHDQLLTMIFAQLTGRSSLRETVLCLRALGTRRYHCGIHDAPLRSTLADANEKRDYRIFQDAALALLQVAGKLLPVNADLRKLQHHIYILDSTTVDLCLGLFPWAVFRKHKAAVKLHTVLDAGRDLPLFVRVSPGKTQDLWLLDQIVGQPGAIYVFDKAYIDFTRLNRLYQSGAFFVTRAKRNMDYKIIQRLPVPTGGAVRSDCLIRLRGPVSSRKFPHALRLIKYVDPEKHKRLQFMTNHLAPPSNTIALLYCKRWRIELFFKWIKQHLRIKRFFGVSPNAVKIQVWVAVIVYVLLALLKHRQQLSQSLNDIFQVLGVTLCEKVPVSQLFSQTETQHSDHDDHKQLSLFEL